METDTAALAIELDALVGKIEKMWRKANDPAATPAERELFEAKALSLMERHRIDRAMLNLHSDDVLVDVGYGTIKGRYGRVQIELIDSVARAYGCRVYWSGWGMTYNVGVFGFRSDTGKVIHLSKWLLTEAMSEAAKQSRGKTGETFSLRRSFLLGFSAAIRQRLREAARIAREDSTVEHGNATEGACLVLVDREKQVQEVYSRRSYRSANGLSRAGSAGYAAGHSAGMGADLSGGKNRVTGGMKALA